MVFMSVLIIMKVQKFLVNKVLYKTSKLKGGLKLELN